MPADGISRFRPSMMFLLRKPGNQALILSVPYTAFRWLILRKSCFSERSSRWSVSWRMNPGRWINAFLPWADTGPCRFGWIDGPKGAVEDFFDFDMPSGNYKGGLHAGELKAYIQLCLALSEMAKEVKYASAKPQQIENQRFAMRTWLNRLGFIGDEFKTARQVFTRHLDGNSAFRYGTIQAGD